MLNDDCYAVVMAGGAGTRLWPLSRQDTPKHFLKLFDGKSLIELTIEKLKDLIPADRIIVLTSIKYQALARQTLPHLPPENFIYEPCIRDTASAIGLAATVLKHRCETATMIVLTADQIIEPAAQFNTAVAHACDFLAKHPGMLIAFGVEAASPNTLVGWQQLGDSLGFADGEVRKIVAFTEKPELDIAQRFMDDGGYCWNSGQFAWKAETILNEIATHLPEAATLLKEIGAAWNTERQNQELSDVFPKMPTGSIDYQVMQKTNNACSILLPCSWEDMGTHAALIDRIGTQDKTNVMVGKAVVTGTGNRVMATTGQYVVVASDNVTVVVTNNTVFVGDPNTDMKALVERVAQQVPEIV